METEGRYTIVGILVVTVAVLLGAAVVWLTGGADRIAYQTYTIYFKHQSLDGLAIGSPVKMRGIKVGVVAGYRFATGRDEAVSVTARIDEGVPVHVGAVAYIKRNLVTGIATVEITNGLSDSPLLVYVRPGERYPVIAEGSSDIDKVTTAVSRLAVNGAQVLDKMSLLMSDENREAITATLASLREVSAYIAENKTALADTAQSVREASDQVKLAGDNVSKAATRIERNVDKVSTNADAALKQATAVLGKLDTDVGMISERVQQLVDTGTLEMTNVSRDVRRSADALTAAGQRLSNPRDIIFGPASQQLGPGEELK